MLNLARDYSRFVITFFDVLSASAPHIYASALPLSPKMSMVRQKYKHCARPLARVVHGLPVSWELAVAVAYRNSLGNVVAWSPCNRFIAIATREAVEICDAVTLNLLSTFKFPPHFIADWLSFSPDGRILTQLDFWGFLTLDIQTGGSVYTILPDELGVGFLNPQSPYSMDGRILTVLSHNHPTLNIIIATYNLSTSHTHCYPDSEGRIIPPTWTHGEFLQFATAKTGCITIWETEPTFTRAPEMVESFPLPDEIAKTEASELSLFLPALYRLAVVLENTHFIWDARGSKLLLKLSPPPAHDMSFSPDGRFFACVIGGAWVGVWKEESPVGYVLH